MQEMILGLLILIRSVESTDGMDVRANGNEYQITQKCVNDVNRIYKRNYVWKRDCRDRRCSENIALLYLTYYGTKYQREFGKVPTRDILARIYNRGYDGMKRGEGSEYVRKIKAAEIMKKRGK